MRNSILYIHWGIGMVLFSVINILIDFIFSFIFSKALGEIPAVWDIGRNGAYSNHPLKPLVKVTLCGH